MGLKEKRASLLGDINENIPQNAGAKEERKARGYLITVGNIKRLKELNYIFDKEYSDMVNEAIEDYYNKKKK